MTNPEDKSRGQIFDQQSQVERPGEGQGRQDGVHNRLPEDPSRVRRRRPPEGTDSPEQHRKGAESPKQHGRGRA